MGILNALKDLFKGKGGTSVDDFNITDSAVSSTMRSATSLSVRADPQEFQAAADGVRVYRVSGAARHRRNQI